MHYREGLLLRLLGVSAVASGCMIDSDVQLQAEASTYQSMTKVNAQTFTTQQHQGNPQVNVWTNTLATSPFRTLSAQPGTIVELPVGAMIVKEMLDAAGQPEFLTVMVKQAPGFDSVNQDWWYGRLNVDGSAASGNFIGKVGFCIACHAGAPNNNYLFGVAPTQLRTFNDSRDWWRNFSRRVGRPRTQLNIASGTATLTAQPCGVGARWCWQSIQIANEPQQLVRIPDIKLDFAARSHAHRRCATRHGSNSCVAGICKPSVHAAGSTCRRLTSTARPTRFFNQA